MSYPENRPPAGNRPARRPRRTGLAVALAAVVPGAVAGWLVWSGTHGHADGDPVGSGPRAVLAPPTSSPGPSSGSSPGASPRGGSGTRAGKPLAGRVVAVDPGHNPHNYQHPDEINAQVKVGNGSKECDTTGTSTDDGYSEAAFTLDVTHRLAAILRSQGAKVVLTYDGDRPFGPCVTERAAIGNAAEADAALSIHADGAPVGRRGFHVIMPGAVHEGGADNRAVVAPSRRLGVDLADAFAKSTGSARSNYIGGGTGLDTRKDLGGLNLTTVPKVFIECGNMRDPHDAALLTSADWRQRAAAGMAEGIDRFLEQGGSGA